MKQTFLVLNPGSSSEKISVFEAGKLVFDEEFEKLTREKGKATPFEEFLQNFDKPLTAILIRLVASGKYFTCPRLVDENTEKELEKIRPFSPIHVPLAEADIELAKNYFKDTPILLISDSEFLAKSSRRDFVYALPKEYTKEAGIARYGAHGLSYGYIINKLKEINKLEPKTIVCHLGSGCSVTAFEDGEPVYTSMGETPVEGLMSSSRPGSLDPVVVAYLTEKYGFAKVSEILTKESGFKALSGSNDMREVMQRAESGDQGSIIALELFVEGILDKIGSFAARMGGLDELVFSGTVGKRSAFTQSRIVAKLTFLGFSLKSEALPVPSAEFKTYSDASAVTKNIKSLTKDTGFVEISSDDSKPILVVPTDEAAYMAAVAADFFSEDGAPLA